MALRRYRVVRFTSHYGVIDHGEPVKNEAGDVVMTTIGPGVEGAGESVPLYRQDGDPESADTKTTVVFRAADLSPESKAAAVAERDRLLAGVS